MSIVQVYLPTTGHTDQEIEEFFEKLQYVYEKLPKRDIKIIMGDFNASVGKKSDDHNMLLPKIKLRFNVGKKKRKQKIDIEKLLTNKETKMEYQVELKNRFNCLLDTIDNLDIDEAVEKTNDIYKNIASEILGHVKPKKSISSKQYTKEKQDGKDTY